MNLRSQSLLSGIILIIMGVVAGYTIGAKLPEFYSLSPVELNHNLNDYKMVLLGLIITIILDFILSYTLYKFFESTNEKLAKLSGIIRFVYSIIFSVAAVFLFQNLSSEETAQNFYLFQLIWTIGLAIFGFHVILLGVLSKMHKRVPKWLWMTTLTAGYSYTFVSILKVISPTSDVVNTIEMSLALPMALGELGLAIWLIAKGGLQTNVISKI